MIIIGGILLTSAFGVIEYYLREKIKESLQTSPLYKFIIISLLIIIPALPTILGIYFYNDSSENTLVAEETPPQKSKEEVYHEIGKDIYNIADEKIKEIKTNREEKKNNYEASREQRWVYQIGDMMNDKDLVLELYKKIRTIPNLCVFKEGKEYFIFKNITDYSNLKDSLEILKLQINNIARVDTIDLMAYSGNEKEKLHLTDPLKFRKEKIKLDCYECNKK